MITDEQSLCAACGADCTDCEHALSRSQGRAVGLDSETALVCWPCAQRIARAERERLDGAILDREAAS